MAGGWYYARRRGYENAGRAQLDERLECGCRIRHVLGGTIDEIISDCHFPIFLQRAGLGLSLREKPDNIHQDADRRDVPDERTR
jgi:hypothetical protein